MNVIATSAVDAIDWYRRAISPHKGFACAYRVKWRGRSCAGVVRAALVNEGALAGVGALFRQPFRCYAAACSLADEQNPAEPKKDEEGLKPEDADFCAKWAAMEGAWWCCFLPFTIS